MRYLAILLLGGFLLAPSFPALAGSLPPPECKPVSKAGAGGQALKAEMCLKKTGPFKHDFYILSLNGTKVFEIIDDKVATFDKVSNGKRVTGTCKSKVGEYRGVPMELARTCTVSVDGVNIGSVTFEFK